MVKPSRPVLRWHGGKWRLAPWIISFFPGHRVYVEPFGGAASVLVRKKRAYAEVYNDLDQQVVNLFRVLRDESSASRLIALLSLTPFAREEFELSYLDCDDPIERARRLVILSFMGFGSTAHNHLSTGFRSNSNRSWTIPAHDWANYPDNLQAIVDRLRGVIIENRDAMEIMSQHDSPETLHYVDPPYLWATRQKEKHPYRHEMEDADHTRLLEFLQRLTGMVAVSGYPHAFYDLALQGWQRVERAALADGALDRIEVLWINPAASRRHGQTEMFDGERIATGAENEMRTLPTKSHDKSDASWTQPPSNPLNSLI